MKSNPRKYTKIMPIDPSPIKTTPSMGIAINETITNCSKKEVVPAAHKIKL
jgi:hypothetical protein